MSLVHCLAYNLTEGYWMDSGRTVERCCYTVEKVRPQLWKTMSYKPNLLLFKIIHCKQNKKAFFCLIKWFQCMLYHFVKSLAKFTDKKQLEVLLSNNVLCFNCYNYIFFSNNKPSHQPENTKRNLQVIQLLFGQNVIYNTSDWC